MLAWHRRQINMQLGYRMLIEPAVAEQADAARSGCYEPLLMDLLHRLLPDDGVFLDIGANVGFFTCSLAAKPGFAGQVHAFEPAGCNHARLLKNIQLNQLVGVVSTWKLALANQTGTLNLYVVPEGEANNAVGENMLAPHDKETVSRRGWRVEHAPMTTLDLWAGEQGLARCDFIKVDAEGADLNILLGGAGLIARTRPVIAAELSPYWMAQIGQDVSDVERFCAELEYELYKEVDGRWHPYEDALRPEPMDVPNFMLAPREKRAELRNKLAEVI